MKSTTNTAETHARPSDVPPSHVTHGDAGARFDAEAARRRSRGAYQLLDDALARVSVLEYGLRGRLGNDEDDIDGHGFMLVIGDIVEAISDAQVVLEKPSAGGTKEAEEKHARAEAVASVRRAIEACEAVTPSAMGVEEINIAADLKSLTLAMGHLSAARHDSSGAGPDYDSMDHALHHLTLVKMGLTTTQEALVDAGVVAPGEKE